MYFVMPKLCIHGCRCTRRSYKHRRRTCRAYTWSTRPSSHYGAPAYFTGHNLVLRNIKAQFCLCAGTKTFPEGNSPYFLTSPWIAQSWIKAFAWIQRRQLWRCKKRAIRNVTHAWVPVVVKPSRSGLKAGRGDRAESSFPLTTPLSTWGHEFGVEEVPHPNQGDRTSLWEQTEIRYLTSSVLSTCTMVAREQVARTWKKLGWPGFKCLSILVRRVPPSWLGLATLATLNSWPQVLTGVLIGKHNSAQTPSGN